MTRHRLLRVPSAMGIVVGALWGLHAAVPELPRQGYFLIPLVAVCACAFIAWRASARAGRFEFTRKSGIPIGLSCWFAAATLSAILNWRTDQVLITYCVVFVAGALIFVALSGIRLAPRDLDVAAAGLALGVLVPLVVGLRVFFDEWGSDVSVMLGAYLNVLRMASYEAVTFGNRGNTASFLIIVAPLLLALALDRRRHRGLRAFLCAVLSVIAVNLFILQVRAAFLSMLAMVAVIWAFKQGVRRLPLLAGPLVLVWFLFSSAAPEAGRQMGDQLLAAATVDTVGDSSVRERVDAIREGVRIAERNWLLGIGPGGALTIHSHDSAHQFLVQQAMETGIFGLLGAALFAIGVWLSLIRTMVRSTDDNTDLRFALLVGPATYVLYSVMANAALGFGSFNPWATLLASMLALMPPFAPRPAALSTKRSLIVPRLRGRPLPVPRAAAGLPSRPLSEPMESRS